jgi:hypothetical protein
MTMKQIIRLPTRIIPLPEPIARTNSNELRKNSNADIPVYYPM